MESALPFVRVKGFQIFNDRQGRPRCYHRATRVAVDLVTAPLGSAAFFAECARIAALASKADIAKPGTIGALITRYRAHPSFQDLADRTKSDYQRVFTYLQPIAETPISRFNAPLVVKLRDKAADQHGRRFGNYLKAVLSIVFAFGVERGVLATNPAASIKSLKPAKDAPQANRPWRDEEREAVFSALPSHMLLPVVLMAFTGLDPQDALRLPRTAIRDGQIDTRRGKTAEPVWMPLPAPVAEAMASAPAHDAITLCATSRGKPWTVSGFRASWRPVKVELEKAGAIGPGLTLKGLRHTVATILAELGFDNRAIADMLGQRTEAMAAHYSRRADRSTKNKATAESFELEMARRKGNVVKLPSAIVKSQT